MGDQFTPEARAELVSMFTGMAMQGLLANTGCCLSNPALADAAVGIATDTVNALAKWHAENFKASLPQQPDDSVIKAAARAIVGEFPQ